MSSTYWNDLITRLPDPHLLQTFEWAQLKARYGWEPQYLVWRVGQKGFEVISGDVAGLNPAEAAKSILQTSAGIAAAALVLKKNVLRRRLGAQICILYSPKGPLLRWQDIDLRKRVLDDLQLFARQQGAIFLKVDPDVVLGTGLPDSETDSPNQVGKMVLDELGLRGWKYSGDQIQFKNTVMLNVSASDDELLGRMKQKTRYNVRLGAKKGLSVRLGTEKDWPALYKMYAETSVRDGFIIRDRDYYQTLWKIFEDQSQPLIAEVDGEAIAAVYLFYFGGRAYYLYGMSRDVHRDLMPNYLLQFEAMRWAREKSCEVYDLWGAPDDFNETDSMWGVYRFKEGLGGVVRRTIGAWDFTPRPFLYLLYAQVMPRVLNFMRSLGRQRTRQSLGD